MPYTLTAEDRAQYDDDISPPYLAGLIITTVVVTFIFALRIYAQWLIKNLKAWDNIFAILAFVSTIPQD